MRGAIRFKIDLDRDWMITMKPVVESFPHASTGTFSHIVHDPATRCAAIIDPVLDYDPASGRISAAPARVLLEHVRTHELLVAWLLETHAHADHLSAGDWLKKRFAGARTGIGVGIAGVQRLFRERLGFGAGFRCDGSQFDRLLDEGDTLALGDLEIRVLATPGHTGDGVSYLIGDALFVGDTLFSPAAGTARCDFPGGDARALYESIQRLFELPDATRVFLCHDYPPQGAAARAETSVAEQRAANIHLRDGAGETDFVEMRTRRDASLAVPRLLWPALQFNLGGGRLPEPDAGGRRYFRIPLGSDDLAD